MSRKRYGNDKYNRIKPKVSPLTYVIVGLVLVGIIFTIFFFMDSPKEKIMKEYGRAARQFGYEIELTKDHNLKKQKVDKLMKRIDDGETILLFVGTPACQFCPLTINEVQKAYDQKGIYSNDVSKHIKEISYIEVAGEEFTTKGLDEFYEKYKIEASGVPYFALIKNKEVVAEYELVSDETHAGLTAMQKVITSVDKFFNKMSEELNK